MSHLIVICQRQVCTNKSQPSQPLSSSWKKSLPLNYQSNGCPNSTSSPALESDSRYWLESNSHSSSISTMSTSLLSAFLSASPLTAKCPRHHFFGPWFHPMGTLSTSDPVSQVNLGISQVLRKVILCTCIPWKPMKLIKLNCWIFTKWHKS